MASHEQGPAASRDHGLVAPASREHGPAAHACREQACGGRPAVSRGLMYQALGGRPCSGLLPRARGPVALACSKQALVVDGCREQAPGEQPLTEHTPGEKAPALQVACASNRREEGGEEHTRVACY
ncbi:acrosomal protein SP-10-like [Zingiber officinale]|uniref:acrosomal protein SP-10-like n=1 Tax=Zingiber officinale TaxID=94328 RepID=UPI001C4A8ECA|nr:acrosomal protein SP-10-like [Zingiber officinale]